MRINLDTINQTDEAKLAQALHRVKVEETLGTARGHIARIRGRQPTITAPKLTANPARNGYEIRFGGPIPKELSLELTGNGWRFNRNQNIDPRWWAKQSPEALAFGKQLVQRFNGADETGAAHVPAENNEPLIWTPDAPVFKRITQLVTA